VSQFEHKDETPALNRLIDEIKETSGCLSGDQIMADAAEMTIREQCARLAAIEAAYWGRLEDERVQEISIGAMGAASNICAAILMGKTPEQYEREVRARDGEKT
jgi:hypothetical protein